MQPLVSILIPAFNSERWIADTLRSALDQTWTKKEIIVIDDGSKDRTFSIANRFASKTTQVVRQENQGAAAARNHAYSLCQGDYIQWLDADDLLDPQKISAQLKAAEREHSPRTLFSGAWGRFLIRPKTADFTSSNLWCDLSPAEWLRRKMDENIFMQTSAWLVSRHLSESAGPWDPQFWVDDDGEYFCRILKHSDKVRFIPEAKVYYRNSGPGSLSHIGDSTRKMEAQFTSIHAHIRYLCALEENDRTHSACLRYIQDWLPFFHPERPDLIAKLQNLGAQMGGVIRPPQFPWKYRLFTGLIGYRSAKRIQHRYRCVKYLAAKSYDWAISRFEASNELAGSGRYAKDYSDHPLL